MATWPRSEILANGGTTRTPENRAHLGPFPATSCSCAEWRDCQDTLSRLDDSDGPCNSYSRGMARMRACPSTGLRRSRRILIVARHAGRTRTPVGLAVLAARVPLHNSRRDQRTAIRLAGRSQTRWGRFTAADPLVRPGIAGAKPSLWRSTPPVRLGSHRSSAEIGSTQKGVRARYSRRSDIGKA